MLENPQLDADEQGKKDQKDETQNTKYIMRNTKYQKRDQEDELSSKGG